MNLIPKDLYSITNLVSGLLQCVVLGYGLWLVRRFKVTRVGWPLVCTFSSLALLRLILFPDSLELGVKINIVFGVVALLLIAGMAQMEIILRERQQAEAAREQARLELQNKVHEKTAELTKVNEELTKVNGELQQTAAQLKAEVEERSQMQLQAEKTHREMLIVSRQAGMSDVATGVLHNVGNVLNSVNVSANVLANHLDELKISRITQVAELLQRHGNNLGDYLTNNPQGKRLPEYLMELGKHLTSEQDLLVREVDFVKTKIEHIKQIVGTQQCYGRVSGVTEKVQVTDLVEDLLRIHVADLEEHGVKIHREYAPNLPEISVDKHKVLQILLNLTANAKHACVDSGREERQIRVRVFNGGDRVRVAVTDNGVGIPPENINRIFNHGFTTRKNNGHGFGLHSGALAAKELGGALLAHSDGPGKGATFTLELPLKPKNQIYEN
jgi:C4-dicarboxylate-specific signal transduction histidine kinase